MDLFPCNIFTDAAPQQPSIDEPWLVSDAYFCDWLAGVTLKDKV